MTPAKRASAGAGADAILAAYFVRGDDPVLVSDALSALVHRLLGDDDAGLDLGKTWQQSVLLLRAHQRFAELGYPVLLSASNKTFLGKLLDLEINERREASHAATAIGVGLGCRIIRAHDVKGTRRVCDTIAAVLEAE